MRVLFTGATGVLGREALPALIAAGHDVTGLARGDDDAAWLREIGARPASLDLFDGDQVNAAVAGHDAVVHFATAIPPFARMTKRDAWAVNDRLRTEATRTLVDAALAHGVERFMFPSIVFIYADGGDAWLDETAAISPVWDALDSALDAESEVRRFADGGGSGIVLRLGRLYGPGRASSELIQAVSTSRRKAPIVGSGRNFVSSIHSADVGSAVPIALTVPGGTFNVVDDEPVTAERLAASLADALGVGVPAKVPPVAARLAAGKAAALLTVSHRVSNGAFREATGWKPAHPSVVEGWHAVIASSKAQRQHRSRRPPGR
jgi:nucleoside-diphosphate-sugar epimerase